jgi:hypothetical protein
VRVEKSIAGLSVRYPELCHLLQLRNDLADARKLVYPEQRQESPHVTWSFPPAVKPHFPMVFNRVMTREILERKLVRRCPPVYY